MTMTSTHCCAFAVQHHTTYAFTVEGCGQWLRFKSGKARDSSNNGRI